MDGETRALKLIWTLAENAKKIKVSLACGDSKEASKLVGERVELVECLRELMDAKVSIASSDIKGEMELLMKDMKKDISEAADEIKKRNSALLKELSRVSRAKRIVAYAASSNPAYAISRVRERDKIQGGLYGY